LPNNNVFVEEFLEQSR